MEASSALGIADATLKLVTTAAVRTHLLRVPPQELSPAQIDAYPALVAEAKRTSGAYTVASGGESDALVSVSIVDAATTLSRRMFACLEYNVESGEIAAQLAAIRRGAGYADLANDLEALGTLYVEHAPTLRLDVQKYRASDAAQSAQFASDIRVARVGGQRVSTKKAGAAWADAFYALRDVHDDIIAAGRYLDRKNPKLLARWVSLNTNVGTPKGKKDKEPKV